MTMTRMYFAVILGCTSATALGQAIDVPVSTKGGFVKNAPYSADVVKERQQILGDGNQIAQRSSDRTYRDSAGRVRSEHLDENGNLQAVTISDPVAGIFWTVNPGTKTALQMTMQRSVRNDEQSGRVVREKSPVRIVPNGILARDTGMPPQINPVLSSAFADIRWSRQAQQRDLGTRDIDGIKATGRVRSYEIPAGAVGNRNAIVVSDETWYAPDLRITLSSKHSDPRTGDTWFRVENIKREEPAPALFAPPPDYTVRDIKPRVNPANAQ